MNDPTPTALSRQLGEADHAWQLEKSRIWLARSVPWLLGSGLLAVAADAFLQLGVAARIACLGGGALGVLGSIFVSWRLARRRNPAERTARYLESRSPALGSRLINALQLATQATDARVPAQTRTMAAAAVDRYGKELQATDLPELARTGATRLWARRAGWAALGCLALLAAFYPVTSMVLPRFFDPLGDHPPYAFTRLEILDPGPTGADVVYGSALSVRVGWSGHEPRELFLTVHPPDRPQEAATVPLIREFGKGFVVRLPDVQSDLLLVAHARDHSYRSPQRAARVLLTPRLEQAWIEITPPAYTGLRAEERKSDLKAATALLGSKVRFRLKSNRPLRSGRLDLLRDGSAGESIDLSPRGPNEVSGEFIASAEARVRLQLTDVAGLVSRPLPELALAVTHDLAPQVYVTEPGQDGFVSMGLVLQAKFDAQDDYGVKTLRIHRALNGVFGEPLVFETAGIRRDVAQTIAFDLPRLGVQPGDRISFFAEAIDTAPDPHLARSKTVTMTLISEEEYNQFVREQTDLRDLSGKYESLLAELAALRDEQKALAESAQALREKLAKEGPSEAKTQEFATLSARQQALNEKIEQTAGRMEQLVRPKPAYDFERDLGQQLAAEAKRLRESAAQSRQETEAAGQQAAGPSNEEAAGALELQAREQAKRLGAGEEKLAGQVRQPLQDLSRLHDLVGDFNIFERAYRTQQSLAEQLRAYEQKSGTLSREDQLALKDLAAQEEAVRAVLEQLPGRLRQHAEAAEEKFPKAAESGRTLAEAIEQGRFAPQADQATQRLLAADGRNGALLARRLERDMAALFGQCQAREGAAGDEVDRYLSLAQLGSAAGRGKTWEQMKQSRKASIPGGSLPGLGRGAAEASGYSTSAEAPPNVLGAEPAPPRESQASGRTQGRQGQGNGSGSGAAVPAGAPVVLRGLNPTDRQSDEVPRELGAERYRDLVDEYFKRLTRPQ